MVVIKKERIFVKHTYHDHSKDPVGGDVEEECQLQQGHEVHCISETIQKRKGPRGGVLRPFPERLHAMLCDVEQQGLSHIVSWQPHGRCFLIHIREDFVSKVLQKYFKHKKLTSFQRQLNLYGFARLTTGIDRGGYYHELFLHARPDVCKRMVRTRVKGHGCKPAASPATEPNFYTMTSCNHKEQGLILPEEGEKETGLLAASSAKTKIEGKRSDSSVVGHEDGTEHQSQVSITLARNGSLLHHVADRVLSERKSEDHSRMLLQKKPNENLLFLDVNYIQDDDAQNQGIDKMLKVLDDENFEAFLQETHEPPLLQQEVVEQERYDYSRDCDDQKAVFATFPVKFEDIHHGFFDIELPIPPAQARN